MHRLFEPIIEPLLEAVNPRAVLQIGGTDAAATRLLARHCRERDRILHVVDPRPSAEVEQEGARRPDRVLLHRLLPLNAVSRLEIPEVVLLDGDPNWYIVYNLLKLLERHSLGHSRGLPVVAIHDAGPPHDRSDAFRDRTTVPRAHRAPGSRSGVRTAVEDFATECAAPLVLRIAAGFQGLAVVAPEAAVARNRELASLMDSLEPPRPARSLVERIEEARQRAEERLARLRERVRTRMRENRRRLEGARDTLAQKGAELQAVQSALGGTRILAERKTRQCERLRRAGRSLRRCRRAPVPPAREPGEGERLLERRLRERRDEIQGLRRLVQRRDRAAASILAALDARRHGAGNGTRPGDDALERIRRLLAEREAAWARDRVLARVSQAEVEGLETDLRTLVGCLDALGPGLRRMLRSRQWRTGSLLAALWRAVSLGRRTDSPAEGLESLARRLEAWRGPPAQRLELIHCGLEGAPEREIPGTGTGGRSGVALYEQGSATFRFRYLLAPGPMDRAYRLRPPIEGARPLAGDWFGKGTDGIGVFDPRTSTFHLKAPPCLGAFDLHVPFGPKDAGWIPLMGDWNGDGIDTPGLYDPKASRFHLRNSTAPGPASLQFRFGGRGRDRIPLRGDWSGSGRDAVGLYDPATSTFLLRHVLGEGEPDLVFRFGKGDAGMFPIVGDWTGGGSDLVGLYDPDRRVLHLRFELGPGDSDASLRLEGVEPGAWPVAGRWTGG